MKSTLKLMSITLALSLVMLSCNKDDDGPMMANPKLSSVKYTPNKLQAKEKAAFSSKSAAVNPKKASVTFKISKISKDKKKFTNPKSGGFKIDGKGVISAPKNHKLTAGTYALTVSATTKKDKKKKKKEKPISKTTTYTVVITKAATAKLSSVSYTSNKLNGKEKTAVAGKSAKLDPKGASATFAISKISKGGKAFSNPKTGGFKIDSKGKVTLPKDHKIAKGSYELTIVATDKNDKKNKKSTKVTVVIG